MVTDAKKGIDEKIQTMDASSVIAKPIQSADKRMTVYAEQRKTTETGNTVTWLADIDGVYARIVYNVGTNPYPVTDYFLTNVSISEFQYN